MKELRKEIKKVRRKLIEKVRNEGLYENFGQKEIRRLKDKFIDVSSYTEEMNKKRRLLNNFNDWCINYTQ